MSLTRATFRVIDTNFGNQNITTTGALTANRIAINTPILYGFEGLHLANNAGVLFYSTNGFTAGLSGVQMFKWTDNNFYFDNFDKDIIIRGTSSTERMRITSQGRVGIGFTAPGATLSVSRGTAPNGTAQFSGTTWASHFSFDTDEHTYIRGGKTTSNVYIGDTNTGSVIMGTGGGDVGAGTAPGANWAASGPNKPKLHVKGDNGDDYVTLLEGSGTTFTPVLALKSIDASSANYRVPTIQFHNESNIPVATIFARLLNSAGGFDGGVDIDIRTTPPGARNTDRRAESILINHNGITYPYCAANDNGLGGQAASIGLTYRYSQALFFAHVDTVGAVAIIGNASDYRIKSNVTNLESSLNRVCQMRPVKYNPKAPDGTVDNNVVFHGLIAHELQEILPTAVVGEKDKVGPDGKPCLQTVHYAGLVPDLIKAVQELKAIVDTQAQTISKLEAGVAQLKSAS